MSVDVAAGLALISITTTLLSPNETIKTWLHSDAVTNVSVPTADSTNPRKDRIVAKFDMTIDPNGAASNNVSIELVEGTPAGSPSAPATPSNAISLAIIDVPASDTAIGNAQITDDRTYVQVGASVLADLQRESTALKTTRLKLANATTLTLASDAITVTQPYHKVDTQAAAASDDLATITAGYGSGEIVVLFAANDARTVVVKNGTGNILTADGADFSIDTDDKSITLIYDGTNWKEIARGVGSPATQLTTKCVYSSGTPSSQLSNPTSITAFDTHTHAIAANDITENVVYEVDCMITGTQAAGAVWVGIMLGSTKIVQAYSSPTGAFKIHFHGWICGTAAAGASVAVKGACSNMSDGAVDETSNFESANVATNGGLTLQIGAYFDSSNASNNITLSAAVFTKKSETAF